MVLCPGCNARNANHSAFCIRCGGSLDDFARRDPAGSTDALSAVMPEDTPASLVDRAAAQLADGHAQAAVDDCKRAAALSPGEVQAYAVMGMAYEQLGDLPAALEAYDTVVTLAPERNAERQKAALLRLRLHQHAPEAPRRATRPPRAEGAGVLAIWKGWYEVARQWVVAHPAPAAGGTAFLLMFVLLSLLVVHSNRVQAREARDQAYEQLVRQGDQALSEGRYAEATLQYAEAYKLKQDDENMRRNWEQAHQLALQVPAAEGMTPTQLAQLPVYVPDPSGRNPFSPVPVQSTPAGAAGMPGAMTTGAAVPPAPVPAPTRPPSVETIRDRGRQMPSATNTTPDGRKRYSTGVVNPITPVPVKPATPAPEPATPDPTYNKPRGEITISISDRKPTQPTTPAHGRPFLGDPDALRTQGRAAAAAGRYGEAATYFDKAADGFAAQGDSGADASARTCRKEANAARTAAAEANR